MPQEFESNMNDPVILKNIFCYFLSILPKTENYFESAAGGLLRFGKVFDKDIRRNHDIKPKKHDFRKVSQKFDVIFPMKIVSRVQI